MPFTYSPDTGRYRDQATGRLISEAAIRQAVDQVADAASDRLAALTARLRSGELRVAEWELEAIRVTKQAHVAAGLVAHGGRAQMTPSAWGYLGSRLRAEYGYLRAFAADIASGVLPDDGRLESRAAMYGQAARSTFTAVTARQRTALGYVSERNILGAAEHCEACVAESARGWVPIGSLSLPGTRTCLSMCRCRISYSKQAALAA